MGLTDDNTDLRGKEYWSETVLDALDFSSSPPTASAYSAAETAVSPLSPAELEDHDVPPWALTWPGGQLTGVGRCGRFAENIERYERVFGRGFGGGKSGGGGGGGEEDGEERREKKWVDVVNLADMNDEGELKSLLQSLVRRLDLGGKTPQSLAATYASVALYAALAAEGGRAVVRNAGAPDKGLPWEVTAAQEAALRRRFEGERERVERLAGRKMEGW